MDDGYDIKADLVIVIQIKDLEKFKEILYSSSVDILRIVDHDFKNIFHEIAASSVPELIILEFLQVILTYFYKNYNETALAQIGVLLNKPTKNTKSTPLMLAVTGSKLVI
jgi:hypothetical protein